jgi:epoxyqueuosine reductase
LERAIFARYARGDDYHDVITARLKELLAFLKEQAGADADGRVYVDAGPILEREAAQKAGLGWFGKNTMLINTRRGSYFFLGEIVTNVALEPDEPAVGGCGTCTRCLDACPTGAIIEPYKLDARRCLSYLTIELKGAIPEALQPALGEAGNRIFGCDICQEVCPFSQRRSVPTSEPAFQPREATTVPRLVDMLKMTQEEFREKFKGSPVTRAKWRGLLRNVAAALSASDVPEAEAALVEALNHEEPLVREQAEMSLKALRTRNPAGPFCPDSTRQEFRAYPKEGLRE